MGTPGCRPGSAPAFPLAAAVVEQPRPPRASLCPPVHHRHAVTRVRWLACYEVVGRYAPEPQHPYFPPVIDTLYGLPLRADQVLPDVPARTSS